nr:CKLF-like MARVEL transmembrane domain-containing protein 5 [Loxodonta africana]
MGGGQATLPACWRDRSPLRHSSRHTAPPCPPTIRLCPLVLAATARSWEGGNAAWARLQLLPSLKGKGRNKEPRKRVKVRRGGHNFFRLRSFGGTQSCPCFSAHLPAPPISSVEPLLSPFSPSPGWVSSEKGEGLATLIWAASLAAALVWAQRAGFLDNFQVFCTFLLLLSAPSSCQVSFSLPGCWWWCGGLCPADPMKMLGARDRPGWPPGEGTAAGLQGFAVDKTFLSSLRGILLETELALTFIIFICFTASISAYMAAPLLEFFITLAFLFLYATQYYKRLDRLNWPCLDFLRCVSAIIIFLVVSFAAVTSRDGAAIAAFVFGIILVSVLAFDAFKIYQTEMAPSATEGDQQ